MRQRETHEPYETRETKSERVYYIMFDFEYKKLWNSQENTDKLFQELTIEEQKQVSKLVAKLHKDLAKFGSKASIAYSIVLHVMEHKVELVPVKQLRLIQVKPYQKAEPPVVLNGPVDW
jgi:hypothetical protein